MKKFHLFTVFYLVAILFASCNKAEELGPEPCTGVEPVRVITYVVNNSFFPMSSQYYWLYNDSVFDALGNLESATVRMLSAKDSYTHSFREPKSPILISFSSILPDLAFRNDTVFLVGSRNELYRRSCVKLVSPFLFPTTDSVFFPVSDTLMPFPQEIITPAGSYANNYIRKNSLQTYIFNREVGLLHFSIKERNAATGEVRLKRSLWLKEAVLNPTTGRLDE